MMHNTRNGFSQIKYSKGNVCGCVCETERDGGGEEEREVGEREEGMRWETMERRER